MSNEKQETSAGIIAEMRQGTRLPGYWRSCDVNEILQYHADRLEAAMKRERLLSKSPENDNSGSAIYTAGNMAAMREALSDACYAMFNFLKTQTGGYEEMANALDKAKAALASPPRNCDMFADAESARQAWLDDAENWDEFGSPKLELHEWLYAAAKEGGEK